MGKRKERRLAAISAAGRRVKLDLFAEPSGDLGGSSGQDEVGGDNDSKNCAELPNSPSSSGQQSENPLLLLEQYSDDELEEESSKNLNHSIVENFLADFDDQENVAAGKDCEDIGTCEYKDLAASNVETRDVQNVSVSPDDLQKVEERENDSTDLVDLHKDMDSTEQISVPAASDIQVAGELGSGWKIVLHEESQRYYYWNTLSGETSWDVPDVLAQGTVSTFEQKDVADTEGRETYVLGTYRSSSPLDVELEDTIASNPNNGSMAVNSNPETKEIYEAYTGDNPNGEEGGHYLKQNDVKTSPGPITASNLETYSPGNLVSHRQLDNALSGNGSATGADSDKGIQVIRDNEELETPVDISGLVRHAEYLLEKLMSFKRSEVHKQGHSQVSKHILELQIRLHDIKSLLSYRSSMLPFWLHSERQLKQLEAVINDEVLHESEKTWDVDARQKSQDTTSGDDTKPDAKEKTTMCFASDNSRASDYVSIAAEVQKESHGEAYSTASAHTAHASSGAIPRSIFDCGTGGNGDYITPKTVLSPSEDVDMDVDMEVEEAVPVSHAIVGDALGPQTIPNPPAKNEPEEGFGVPPPGPPPDDEWIPPPPPDNEVFPPPPPDEPPESSFPPPPSDLDTLQPFSYAEQYNLTYPVSNFEYYGQTNTVPSSGYYTLAAAPHPPIYYEATPNTYPVAVPALVNPVEPITYYGPQNGTVPPGVESSGLHISSSYDNFGSDQILLPNTKVDVPSGVGETGTTSVEDPFASAPGHVPPTISVTQGAVVSTPTVVTTAVAATETVPKVQSKVLRNKKRTTAVVSTLKSNKKVSSLVDKWKAAKEEMHEDEEDEPENAYEFLEKKRRREIEEWRAQQIASGEAKDNANFQPVRGDWRERVKRKKAQMKSEAVVHSPSDGLTDDGNHQQPDLTELSKDLPSGWQAYWDESSKQVYYGNTATSETTWLKPT